MQGAVPRNTFCPICGVVLHFGSSYSRRDSSWIEKIRGILVDDTNTDIASLTGVGSLQDINVLSVPVDSSRSSGSYPPPGCVKMTLFQPDKPAWGYACHEACWSLLLTRLSSVGICDKDTIARSFTRLLRATVCYHSSSFDFGHDYAGAAALHRPVGSVDETRGALALIYQSPLEYPSLRYLKKHVPGVLFSSFPRRSTPIDSPSYSTAGGGQNASILGRLPAEITLEVVSYLPSTDVAQLRLACRALGWLLTWDQLPSSFWKSRFMLGNELGYLFPWANGKRNWRRLYFGTRAYLHERGPVLENRRRICNLLEPIATLVESDIKNPKELYGASVSFSQNTIINNSVVGLPTHFSSLQSLSCQAPLAEGFYGSTEKSNDTLYHRLVSFPLETSGFGARISISSIKISGNSCISGVCYRDLDESEDSEYQRLGYYTGVGEQSVEIPPSRKIQGFDVSFRLSGLVGLRVRYANSDSNDDSDGQFTLSKWLGTSCGEGVAYGTLTLSQGVSKPYLAVSLDAFKIVTIASAQALDPLSDARYNTKHRVPLGPQSYLWMSRMPTHKELVVGSMKPEGQRGLALYDIDFGGPDGILLGSLTSLVVYLHLGFISGFKFSYNTGEILIFGTQGALALPFLINGPSGERITGVKLITAYVNSPSGIQISTNFGQINNFVIMKSICDICRHSEELDLPEGFTITGFTACQKPRQSHYSGLGLQGQRVPPGPTTPNSLLQPMGSFLGLDATKYNGFPSYASLVGVRRIQASIGETSHCRPVPYISGLRMDYRDSRTSVILGQWVNASKTFDLFPDDEVDGLVVRYEQGERPSANRASILSISFKTTCGRSITFRSSRNRARKSLSMFRYGDAEPRGKLVGMLWVTSLAYDLVRARVASGERLCYVEPENTAKEGHKP